MGVAVTLLGCSHPFADAALQGFAADGADHSSPRSRSSCPWWPPKPAEHYKQTLLPQVKQDGTTWNHYSTQADMASAIRTGPLHCGYESWDSSPTPPSRRWDATTASAAGHSPPSAACSSQSASCSPSACGRTLCAASPGTYHSQEKIHFSQWQAHLDTKLLKG